MLAKPVHPSTRVRASGAIDAPKEPRIWTVGEKIGAAIRQYRNKQSEYYGGPTQAHGHIYVVPTGIIFGQVL